MYRIARRYRTRAVHKSLKKYSTGYRGYRVVLRSHTTHSIDSLSLDRPHGGDTRGGDEREGQEEGEGGGSGRGGEGEGARGRGAGAEPTECDYRSSKDNLTHARNATTGQLERAISQGTCAPTQETNHSHAPCVSTGQLKRAISQGTCAPTQETNHSHAPCRRVSSPGPPMLHGRIWNDVLHDAQGFHAIAPPPLPRSS